jgi:hypothetical protein
MNRDMTLWLVKRLVICALPMVVAILLGAGRVPIVVFGALGMLAFMESTYPGPA